MIPTPSPTTYPASGSDDDDNVYASWVFTLVLTLVMAIFGAVLIDTRKNRRGLYDLDAIWAQYALVSFGVSFGSQAFFIYTCLAKTNKDYFLYAAYLIAIKSCSFLFSCFYVYKITNSKAFVMDQDLIAEQITMYGILGVLCCMQPKLVFLFPWDQCDTAIVTCGFPSFRMYCVTTAILITESLLITGVNVMFLLDEQAIWDIELSTRIAFVMTTLGTFLVCFLSVIEMAMLNNSHKARRNREPSFFTQKLIAGEARLNPSA